ncbi:MAG: DUF2254 domain-containing protein, partial [Alphaproteobacteria bacterium]
STVAGLPRHPGSILGVLASCSTPSPGAAVGASSIPSRYRIRIRRFAAHGTLLAFFPRCPLVGSVKIAAVRQSGHPAIRRCPGTKWAVRSLPVIGRDWGGPNGHKRQGNFVNARFKKTVDALAETFWLLPAAMTAAGVGLALLLLAIDRSGMVPRWMLENAWIYNGSGTGARTLLGAVASSTIGVAGTVFSITIAALSLAAGQMGPRLLRNFTKDRANQFVLGAFLGTFSYALMVLRTVRVQDEGAFVPHLSLTVSIVLAFVCVATLVFFVGHMANRINVDTVVGLVSHDMRLAFERIALTEREPEPPPLSFWRDAAAIHDGRHGYLLHLDHEGLAKWAAEKGTAVRLLARPGDFVFPGAPIALMAPAVDGGEDAIREATALSDQRGSSADLEFAVRQLVEVAVRALSPGINDPHTAVSVIDQLGATLCRLAPLQLPTGVVLHEGKTVLVVPAVDYDGLVDAMFHMIRQNGAHSTAILVRLLDVLASVAGCEHDPRRRIALRRHADLVLGDAKRNISTPEDMQDIVRRHAGFVAMAAGGPYRRLATLADRGELPLPMT